ncbi:MAG: type II toxin-antitoxin system VapC family toxin [Planctomycetes bacterium]|nr:type II toxin-antitoxin system VapC family toxin [Planctomycetota bacterium]
MRILLDTHAFLWGLADSGRLSRRALRLMEDEGNELLWSAASSWEVAIKYALGRIRLPEPPGRYLPARLQAQRVDPLPVSDAHAWRVAELPPHHRDPFDRLLIAQALVEGLPIVTADRAFKKYDVDILW